MCHPDCGPIVDRNPEMGTHWHENLDGRCWHYDLDILSGKGGEKLGEPFEMEAAKALRRIAETEELYHDDKTVLIGIALYFEARVQAASRLS